MISARLRYAALGLAAITFGALALMYATAGGWAPAAVCLLLTAACAEACSWVRRAAERLQDLERAARPAPHSLLTACCETAFLTLDAVHGEACRRSR
ncbi:hypothetical protein ACFWZ0_02540 [[Kitasatospora] papulosa]|uniref:hypothetical protein n=1 Tax=[Kitasatospora] papulosa TaxID=1464011 RepID=UPI0036A99BC0